MVKKTRWNSRRTRQVTALRQPCLTETKGCYLLPRAEEEDPMVWVKASVVGGEKQLLAEMGLG